VQPFDRDAPRPIKKPLKISFKGEDKISNVCISKNFE